MDTETMLKWFSQDFDKPRPQKIVMCPFHEEKVPRMIVDLFRQRYHCLGCGRTGKVEDLPNDHEA